MATLKTEGLDDYIRRLEALVDDTDEDIIAVVKAGGDVVADAIREGLNTIPVHPDDEYGTADKPLVGLTAKQKAEVIANYGLAPIRNDDGFINTKAGFKGKSSTKSKKYPNGIPIKTLMRRLESGTSWLRKSPVIRRAVSRAKKAAIETMERELVSRIERRLNNG